MAAPPAVTNTLLIDLDPHALGLLNGDPITTLTDQSGALRHFTQATAARKPTFVTNALNGKSVAAFDGTDDTLKIADTAIVGQSALTLIVVMAQTAVPGSARRGVWSVSGTGNDFDQSAGTGWNSCHTAAAETAWEGQTVGGGANGTQDGDLKTSSTPLGTYAVSTLAVASNAAPTLYINGTAEGTGTALAHATIASKSMNLGSRLYSGTDNDFAFIRVARVLLYAGTVSPSDRAKIHTFIQDTYAITVADYVTAGGGVATGSGAATATVTATGAGNAVAQGSAAATVTVIGQGAGQPVATGSGAAQATVTGTGTGQPVATGAGTATASVTATGTGSAPSLVATGSGAATITVTSSGAGLAIATGTGSFTVTVRAAGAGQAIATGRGAATTTVVASGSGGPLVTLTPTPATRTFVIAAEVRRLTIAREVRREVVLL